MDSSTLDKVEFDEVRRILAGFCRCRLGAHLARRITPSRNIDQIARWLAETTQMVEALREIGLPPLGGVTDITEALDRAKPSGGAAGEDFADIAATLQAARGVREFLLALPETLDLLTSLAGGIGEFDEVVEAVSAVVASDGTILDDASDRLKRLRREIETIGQDIHEVIHGYLRQPEVRRLLQEATVTIHEDRYVLPVRTENRGRLPGVVHRTSGSGATVFVEPNACVRLNNQLADLRDDERAEIVRLLSELAVVVAHRADDITATLRRLAQVDLLAAKAQYAYQFDMACPDLSAEGPVELHQARHPLLIDQAWRQEKDGAGPEERHPVVPIDVRLGLDFDVLVITGSNTGGKTVALKTVALLVLMCQSGMHIPARRGAKLPLFRDVLIDVGDEQSLQQSLSTFGAHIKRLRHILQKADSHVLVLLDELGAGTDPDEGGAIGQAILDELRHRRCRAMVTTHLSVLKAYAFNHDRVDNASVDFDTQTLSPTFHLRIGTPGESHAITVADRLGLGGRVVGAARKHLSSQGKQFTKAIRATGDARKKAEAARADAHTAQLAAQVQAEDYDKKLGELQQVRGDFEAWLAHLPKLQAGDEVFVHSLGKAATLVRLELHKQKAVVDSGSVQVEVPIGELMPEMGQAGVREQIAALREQINQQLQRGRQAAEQARQMEKQYRHSLDDLRRRDEEFTQWVAQISTLRVGDEVPVNRKPGKGVVVSVDLAHLKASVRVGEEEVDLPLAELFPQRGRFAPGTSKRRSRKGRQDDKTRRDKPMRRPKRGMLQTRRNRLQLLAAQPGEEVFVVPFNRRAQLVRIDEEKNQAIVLSGNFEMQVPLTDVQPIGEGSDGDAPPQHRRRPRRDHPPKDRKKPTPDQAPPGDADD
ncbi:MAG: endonuclease MutS2 [Planctomycetota bacterium]